MHEDRWRCAAASIARACHTRRPQQRPPPRSPTRPPPRPPPRRSAASACTAVEQPRRRVGLSQSSAKDFLPAQGERGVRRACNTQSPVTVAPNPLGGTPNRFGLSPEHVGGGKPERVGGVGGVGGSAPQPVGGGPQPVGGPRRPGSRPGTCKSWYYRPPSSISFNPTTVPATRAPGTGVVQRWLPTLLI